MYHEDEGLNYTFGGGKQPRGYGEYERTLNTEDDMAELAEWQYEHQAELDAEAGELVEAEIAENLTVMISFRVTQQQANHIRGRAAGDVVYEEVAPIEPDERL